MKRSKLFTFCFVFMILLNNVVKAKELKEYELSEDILIKLINNKNPSIDKINAIHQQNLINENAFKKNFDFNLYANVNYTKTEDDEKIWTSQRTEEQTYFEGGLSKDFTRGINTKIYFSNDNSDLWTRGFIPKDTYSLNRPALTVNFSIDLWKNFLGHQDVAKKLSLELNRQQSTIKTKIEKNNFYSSMRELYWNLVFKERELNIYEKMVEQAEKNLANVVKRHKAFIVDDGELARAKANVSSKRANYNQIKIEIEKLKKQIKYYLPELTDKNIILTSVNVDHTMEEVKNCNSVAENNESKWQQLSSHWDYLVLMDKVLEADLKTYNRSADFDIKLNLGATFRGIDEKASDSYKDFKEFDRKDYNIGLYVNKTLGSSNKNLELEQIKLVKMNYNINKRDTIANLESFYYSYGDIIKNLFSYLENLNMYKINIEKRVQSSRKKYTQGRVSLNELIQDEDSLIEANLQVIGVENNILSLTMQYLSAFDKIECDFNKKL